MAVRAAKMQKLENGQLVVTWTGLNETDGVFDSGAPVTVGGVEGLTAQFSGNFDTSVTGLLEGSNDGVVWAPLKDVAGANIAAITAASALTTLPLIGSRPLFMRPNLAVAGAGDASSITCILSGSIRL